MTISPVLKNLLTIILITVITAVVLSACSFDPDHQRFASQSKEMQDELILAENWPQLTEFSLKVEKAGDIMAGMPSVTRCMYFASSIDKQEMIETVVATADQFGWVAKRDSTMAKSRSIVAVKTAMRGESMKMIVAIDDSMCGKPPVAGANALRITLLP